jgi:hypothetical protein
VFIFLFFTVPRIIQDISAWNKKVQNKRMPFASFLLVFRVSAAYALASTRDEEERNVA